MRSGRSYVLSGFGPSALSCDSGFKETTEAEINAPGRRCRPRKSEKKRGHLMLKKFLAVGPVEAEMKYCQMDIREV